MSWNDSDKFFCYNYLLHCHFDTFPLLDKASMQLSKLFYAIFLLCMHCIGNTVLRLWLFSSVFFFKISVCCNLLAIIVERSVCIPLFPHKIAANDSMTHDSIALVLPTSFPSDLSLSCFSRDRSASLHFTLIHLELTALICWSVSVPPSLIFCPYPANNSSRKC